MICEDCAAAIDAAPAVWHAVCQAETDRQREILPFALSSCTCQHRVAPTVMRDPPTDVSWIEIH